MKARRPNSPTLTMAADASRNDPRHGRLHAARAGARQAGRQARRHLGLRRGAVRNAHRPAPVPRRGHYRYARGGAQGGAGPGASSRASPPPAAALSGKRSSASACAISATRGSCWTSSRRVAPPRLQARPVAWIGSGRRAAIAAAALAYIAHRHFAEEPPRVLKYVACLPKKRRSRSNVVPAVSPDGRRLLSRLLSGGQTSAVGARSGFARRPAAHRNGGRQLPVLVARQQYHRVFRRMAN